MRWRLVFAGVLVLQMLLAGWALGVPNMMFGAGEPAFVPAEIAPSSAPIDLEQGEAIARRHVAGWAADARLVAALMRLEWSGDVENAEQITLPASGWLLYTYAAGERTLSVYLDRRSGVYITNTQTDYGDDSLPAIDLSTYARGSTTAALTAEVLHGATYRAACPGTRRTALVTPSRITDGAGVVTPIWVVTYADSRYTGDFEVLVQLDAITGNVITSEVSERACAG